MIPSRSLLPLLSLIVLACTDGATDPLADGNAAIRAALTIDPEALPQYVSAPLPAFYDAAVLALEDRTQGAPLTDARGDARSRVVL